MNVKKSSRDFKKGYCTFVSFVQCMYCMYERQCHLKTVTFSFYNGQMGSNALLSALEAYG